MKSSVVEAVTAMLAERDLDTIGDVRAEMALALAEKIDECRHRAGDDKAQGSVAAALAACVKQLEELLHSIEAVSEETQAFCDSLMTLPD